MASENYPQQKGRTIVLTRELDASPDLVFDVLTMPEHIKHWSHAGEGWTTPFAETDLRPGGKLRIGYRSPDGKDDFVLEGTYREIDRPRKLVYYLADGRPVTTTLEPVGNKTRLTIEFEMETEYPQDLQRAGWTEHLDNLEKHVATLAKK